MKKLLQLVLLISIILLGSCSKKAVASQVPEEEYFLSGTNPTFTASVVSEKNDDGTESSYFALNNYRLICKSKEDAIERFKNFKEGYETLKAEDVDRCGFIVVQTLEHLELCVVDKKGDILYSDFDSTPNYAVPDDDLDYDSASTNVAKDQIMSVNENLKLRSGEATSTDVLTVMSVGTKVKILELGKAETIDGIYSNWVKVEVQKGAKDRDGKPIKSGSVGWCYGGYLK